MCYFPLTWKCYFFRIRPLFSIDEHIKHINLILRPFKSDIFFVKGLLWKWTGWCMWKCFLNTAALYPTSLISFYSDNLPILPIKYSLHIFGYELVAEIHNALQRSLEVYVRHGYCLSKESSHLRDNLKIISIHLWLTYLGLSPFEIQLCLDHWSWV